MSDETQENAAVSGITAAPSYRTPADEEVFAQLGAPIPSALIESRPGGGGRQLNYITARTVMNRLDAVVGGPNWETEYFYLGDGTYKCILTVHLPSGRKVSKCGISGLPPTKGGGLEEDDRLKGASSDCLKRAGAEFGIARELYLDGSYYGELARPSQAPQSNTQQQRAPEAPRNAPASSGSRTPAPQQQTNGGAPGRPSGQPARSDDPLEAPTSGKAFWAKMYKLSETTGRDLKANLIAVADKHFPKKKPFEYDTAKLPAAWEEFLQLSGFGTVETESNSEEGPAEPAESKADGPGAPNPLYDRNELIQLIDKHTRAIMAAQWGDLKAYAARQTRIKSALTEQFPELGKIGSIPAIQETKRLAEIEVALEYILNNPDVREKLLAN